MDDLATYLRGRPPVAKLIGFVRTLYSNPLPIGKTLAGVGRCSNPFGASSRAARLAFIYR